jgi:hypothetical protein
VVDPASSVPMAHGEYLGQGEEAAGSAKRWHLGDTAEAARRGKTGGQLRHPDGQRR